MRGCRLLEVWARQMCLRRRTRARGCPMHGAWGWEEGSRRGGGEVGPELAVPAWGKRLRGEGPRHLQRYQPTRAQGLFGRKGPLLEEHCA